MNTTSLGAVKLQARDHSFFLLRFTEEIFDIISHCAVMELYLKAFRANLDVGVGFLQDRATVSSFISHNLGSSFLTILYNLKPPLS